MKIEIEIKTNGKGKENGEEKEMPESEEEMSDEQKVAIVKKLKKNMTLTRMERKLLADYLLEEED